MSKVTLIDSIAALGNSQPICLLLSSIPTPVLCKVGEAICFNQALANLIGYSQEEISTVSELYKLFPEFEEKRLVPLKVVSVENRAGEELILEVAKTSYEDFELWILHDITHHKSAEKALRDSEERFSSILVSAMDAIITVDAEHTIVLFNEAAENIFGYHRNQVLGQPLDILIPHRLRDIHHKHIQNFAKTGVTTRRMGVLGTLVGVRANGEEFPIEASISQARIGSQMLHTVILRDVTERKRLEEEVRRAQEERLARKQTELIESYKKADLIFSALADILPGTVLDGKYKLEKKIGMGGYGVVYRATHLGLDRQVAVKIFRPVSADENRENLNRFRLEGISACRINHNNAVSILDSGVSSESIVYLVMELLEGCSLTEELQQKGVLSIKRCLEILIPTCDVLAEAHRAGIVHRDIKPDNIFLHRSGDHEIVKVVDFGIAKFLNRNSGTIDINNLTVQGLVLGTPTYMAPERLQNQDYDGRSDIYSVGIMFYQMLSGAPPFDNDFEGIFAVALRHISETPESLCEIDPNIPKDVESLVMQALKKDYRERPTAEEMVREMTYLLHNLPEEKLNYIKPGRMSFPVDGAATIKQKVGWNRR